MLYKHQIEDDKLRSIADCLVDSLVSSSDDNTHLQFTIVIVIERVEGLTLKMVGSTPMSC